MKKVIYIITVAILLLVINDISHSIYDIWQKKDYITQAQKELNIQKQENQRLKSALSYSQSQEFIEKQAREKLFMVKNGEQAILIEQGLEKADVSKKEVDPNWRKWWRLFFE